MLTKLKAWLTNVFASEVGVIRPGSEPLDVPMNRKQRRTKESLQRKHAKRRKRRASVSRPKGT